LKFNLKKFLKTLKLNESKISMILGTVVILVTGALIVNYIREKNPDSGTLLDRAGQTTENGFAKTHTVTKGENLWDIAEKEIGSGFNWVDIAKENNLKNPNIISEGQKLNIPSVEVKAVAKSKTDLPTNDISITGATYQVQKGDCLWDIAIRAYGDGYRWTQIADENHLTNPNLIFSGNILTLPR
jgi:nucleoid-associated protein YgaU